MEAAALLGSDRITGGAHLRPHFLRLPSQRSVTCCTGVLPGPAGCCHHPYSHTPPHCLVSHPIPSPPGAPRAARCAAGPRWPLPRLAPRAVGAQPGGGLRLPAGPLPAPLLPTPQVSGRTCFFSFRPAWWRVRFGLPVRAPQPPSPPLGFPIPRQVLGLLAAGRPGVRGAVRRLSGVVHLVRVRQGVDPPPQVGFRRGGVELL